MDRRYTQQACVVGFKRRIEPCDWVLHWRFGDALVGHGEKYTQLCDSKSGDARLCGASNKKTEMRISEVEINRRACGQAARTFALMPDQQSGTHHSFVFGG